MRGVRCSHSYAHTLRLPKSALPNRSDRKRVPELIQRSADELYAWQKSTRKDQVPHILHDGPPYANGKLHLGHALNKILKDFINRFNVLSGKRVEYVPGWDCHGLPIELASVKNQSKKLSAPKRRELAKKLALSMIDQQKAAFRSFGVMADWDTVYMTLTKDYVVRQLTLFSNLVDRKLVFRQRKPVYWSVESRTALAESELEYGERTDISAYLQYKLKTPLNSYESVGLAVWTTTPWTLPSNMAIAINPDLQYSLLETEHGLIVVATNLKENFGGVEIDKFSGTDLLGLEYVCPVTGATHKVVAGDHVTDSSGTGLVHTAPGHGKEDFVVGLREKLDALSPVDSAGKYTSEVSPPELAGLDARKEGTPRVLEILESTNALIRQEPITHSVPLDWRSKTPVMVRATPQFFIDLGADVRDLALEALKNVRFKPETGRQRLVAFTSSRADWCISRQRAWGVPIPVLYHRETGEALLNSESMSHIISVINSYPGDEGLSRWFEEESNVEDWLPPSLQNKNLETIYTKGTDTMDVWFDSGTSWTMLPGQKPAEYYLEGSDQHRGWFQSSLLTRVASTHEPQAPFQNLITHGFILDAKGQKMSKSLGNVVSPEEVLRDIGVDGLRLFIAQSDYTGDISFGKVAVKQVAATVKKFRLTFKYLLGNITTAEQLLENQQLSSLDQYTLAKLAELIDGAKAAYSTQDFSQVVKLFQNMNSQLSSIYFDTAKDSLYADPLNSPRRNATEYVLQQVLSAYVRILSPIMPLLTQEVWDLCPEYVTGGIASPAMAGYPAAPECVVDPGFLKVLALRDTVNEAIELARTDKRVGSSLACDVYIEPSPSVAEALQKHRDLLETLFIASNVHVSHVPPADTEWSYTVSNDQAKVTVTPPSMHKCPRCWVYSSPHEDELCSRCSTAI